MPTRPHIGLDNSAFSGRLRASPRFTRAAAPPVRRPAGYVRRPLARPSVIGPPPQPPAAAQPPAAPVASPQAAIAVVKPEPFAHPGLPKLQRSRVLKRQSLHTRRTTAAKQV